VNRYVRRLQARIVKAVKQGKWRLVKNLQRLLNQWSPACCQASDTGGIVERCKGGDSLDNLVMLHPNCHRQIHSLMKLGADTRFVSAHLTTGS